MLKRGSMGKSKSKQYKENLRALATTTPKKLAKAVLSVTCPRLLVHFLC